MSSELSLLFVGASSVQDAAVKTGRLSTYTSTSTSTNITVNKAKAEIKICFEFNTEIWEALCHF